MAQREYILQELRELNSSLAGIEQYPMYRVPIGYFDNLAGELTDLFVHEDGFVRRIFSPASLPLLDYQTHWLKIKLPLTKDGPYSGISRSTRRLQRPA